MIKGYKLNKLLEQNMNSGKGVNGYKEQLKTLFGITESYNGSPKIDLKNRAIDPKDVSFGEIAHTFLGREFGASDIRRAMALSEQYGSFHEAEGSVVLPSHFANISAFTSTVSGLLDALVMEAYQSPEFIGDTVCEVKEARVQGGKMIGVGNDGQVSGDLLDGEPYPTVGLKETYVTVPDNQRHGVVIQVNEKVYLYDRTDMIQSMAYNAGYSVARDKEVRIADTVLGITNTYSRDGVSANTYLTVAGTSPCNYVNSSTNELLDWTDINNAIQVIEGNTDPLTGFEITMNAPQILVMPQNAMAARVILYPEWIRRNTQSSAEVVQSTSPVPNLELIVANRIWYNRLIAASVSTTNAPARWHLGQFKKAFQYRQIIPFGVQSAPLSSEDTRRDIVGVYVAREHGVSFTKEPRYTYQGTKE